MAFRERLKGAKILAKDILGIKLSFELYEHNIFVIINIRIMNRQKCVELLNYLHEN